MMEKMDERKNEFGREEEKTSNEFGFNEVGGNFLLGCKPIFSHDSKYIFACSKNEVRQYVCENGSLLAAQTIGHKQNIVSIQLNPLSDNQLIATSNDGLVVFWNTTENRVTDEIQLNVNTNYETLISCRFVSNYFYFIISDKNSARSQLFYSPRGFPQQKLHVNKTDSVNPTLNSVCFGPLNDPRFCAAVNNNILHLYEIPVNFSSHKIRHLTDELKQFTCIACHPHDYILATGDSLGRILLWHNNFMDTNRPTKTVMHWHPLAVADLCFSSEGTFLYSVGGEMVLVRWNVSANNCGEKNFLTRIGMPIRFISCDANHELLATCHEDNVINIIGSQMNEIQTTIDGMSIGFGREYSLSTGLLWSKKFNAFVLNGRPGHLQFYAPKFQRQLFQLDVVGQNLMSEERNRVIYPTEVSKAAISRDNKWLASLEIRDDHETLPEIRLKFWLLTGSQFSLNTTIHLPHDSDVNCLKFAPNSLSLVSTSNDKCFKIWTLEEDDDKQWWICTKIGSLNSISISSDACWSDDSSVLAVAFDGIISLWDVCNEKNVKLISRLVAEECLDRKMTKLLLLEFGREEKSQYLVEGREDAIRIWNLINFKVEHKYEPPSPLEYVALNQWNNCLVFFSRSTFNFMKFGSNEILASIKVETNTKVMSGIFVKKKLSPTSSLYSFMGNSVFYFMNSNQELFKLGDTKESETKFVAAEFVEPATPLAMMLLKKREKNEKIEAEEMNTFIQSDMNTDKLVEEMFLKVPSHVLPPINILSKTFLNALLSCQTNALKVPPDPSLSHNCLENGEEDHKNINIESKSEDMEVDVKDVQESEYDYIRENVDADEDYTWLRDSLKQINIDLNK